jgi:hypothetical protein
LIPNGFSSYDIDSLRPHANLLIIYSDKTGKPMRPPTIVPDFLFLMTGKTCGVTRITPKKLSLVLIYLQEIKKNKSPYPALFTNTSILSFSATILPIA